LKKPREPRSRVTALAAGAAAAVVLLGVVIIIKDQFGRQTVVRVPGSDVTIEVRSDGEPPKDAGPLSSTAPASSASQTGPPQTAPPSSTTVRCDPANLKLKIVKSEVTQAIAGKQCEGRFTVCNVGPEYSVPPDTFGPSYGIFIYDDRDRLLFRSFGGMGPGLKAQQTITIAWDTHSNHLGETSEPPFLLQSLGRYRLEICLYRDTREHVLEVSTSPFSAKKAEK
jgi:hypothetical protein